MRKTRKVAICSRDSEENYEWLKDFLENRMCKTTKIKAHPVYITNNTAQFYKDVTGYQFAILYHTKRRGRINITNVTDSLYDQELKFLCQRFGKKHVAVVVDDLENSENSEREKIKNGQPDLKTHAKEVFLFTSEDHHCTKEHLKKMAAGTMKSKMKELKKCIKKGSKRNRAKYNRQEKKKEKRKSRRS